MIVKNEEDWVEQAIDSVISLVHEVIIVYTGSTDQTLERVKRFKPRVIHSEWKDHFGDARNISLDAARYSWILVLDADECIAPTDLRLLQEAMDEPDHGHHLTQRNYVYQNHVHGWERNMAAYEEGREYPGYVDNPLIRFFRTDPELRFHGAVHEIVDPTRLPKRFSFSNLPVVIHHYGKVLGHERVLAKQHLYLRLGKKKLQQDPTNAKAQMDYGIQLQELGRHDEAREPFLKAFEMGGNPASLLHCAVSEKTLEGFGSAAELLEKAARHGLDSFELHLERGNVQLALGEFGKAQDAYWTCLERSVGSPVATFNIGLTYKKMGKLGKAETYYERARSLDPAFVEPALDLAGLRTDVGRFREAADILEPIVNTNPERRESRLALAKTYLLLKQPEDAITLLENRFDDDPVAESLRGAAHLEAGNYDVAREHLENAIRADASLVDARINVSHVYGHTGEFARAVRHLRRGFEKTGNSTLLPALSIYEARAGLLDDALAHLDEVIRSDQATNDHWIYRGLILEQKQLWEEARAHYRTMAQRLPELVDWVGEKLQSLRGTEVVVGIGEPAGWDDPGNARRNDESRHL